MGGRGTQPVGPRVTRRVADMERRLPYPGFISMRGTVFYLPQHHRIRIVITFKQSVGNRTPLKPILVSKPFQGQPDLMRKELLTHMDEVEGKIRAQVFPERGMFLEQCNVTGDPDFLTSTCEGCTSPFCELSNRYRR